MFAEEQKQSGFPRLLKDWRKRRRLSQLDLALEADLSQRHLSFLETGRSQPSRMAILQLGQAMQMPAAEIDALLISAGFAGQSASRQWGSQTKQAIEASLDHVLAGHDPFPAVVVDRIWNLQKANQSALAFFGTLGSSGNPNLLVEIMQPGKIREAIINWPFVARALFRILELEVARRPNDTEAAQLLDQLRVMPEINEAISTPVNESPAPVLTIQFEVDGRQLNLFSMIATIGMSADASLDDIRIETLLPADQETRTWFEGLGN